MRNTLIAVTCALVGVSFPHALEDFHYGELMRFGINLPLGIGILATAYALQLAGIALVLRGDRRGALLLAMMGAIWCAGAIIIHGHDMIFAGPQYRQGLISRLFELIIIALGATAAITGARVARARLDS